MNLSAGRLAGHKNPGVRMKLKDRPWAEGQVFRADRAAAHFGKQGCEMHDIGGREWRLTKQGARRPAMRAHSPRMVDVRVARRIMPLRLHGDVARPVRTVQ